MIQPPRITIDPAVCHGKPCIRGLRCPQVEKAFEDWQFVELGAQHLSVRD